jgi:hypothetical protein
LSVIRVQSSLPLMSSTEASESLNFSLSNQGL